MIHLITGGSGSGKSVYAENWLIRQGGREACGKEKPFLYIATMRPFGQESRQKIMRHRNQRAGKGFATLECYQDLEAQMKEAGSTVMEHYEAAKDFIGQKTEEYSEKAENIKKELMR